MITDADIQKLRSVFLTKDDLAELREDMRREIVTRKEFQDFQGEMYEFKKEMYAFWKEMYEFKKEMYEFKKEMYAFRKEMYEFKKEMYEFRDEMYAFRDEVRELFKGMTASIIEEIGSAYRDISTIEDSVTKFRREHRGHRVAIGNHESRLARLEGTAAGV